MTTPLTVLDLRKLLEKKFGAEVFAETFQPTGYIPSGIATLDYALGTPGYALGRLTLVRGLFSSGKSALAHLAIAECQRIGGVAALFETENALDLDRAATIGVNVPDLYPLILQTPTVEDTLDKHFEFLRVLREHEPDRPALIVWDSIAATPTKKDLEEDAGSAGFGAHSRLISQGLRRLTHEIGRQRVALLWINQTRLKASAMPYQDPTTMVAALPLEFHSTAMLRVARSSKEGVRGEDPTGIGMTITVEKNKLGPPWRKAEVTLDFARGFLTDEPWLDLAVQLDLVKKNGSWHSYAGHKFQAKDWPTILADTDVLAATRTALQATYASSARSAVAV